MSPAPVVDGFVADGRVARLATLDGRGHPHLVPVCYATDGRAYYSAVDAKPKRTPPERLARLRNLRTDPRVALLVDRYDEDWRRLRWVMVQGRAELLAEGRESEAARALLRAKYPHYRPGGQAPLPAAAPVIKIVPERVVAWRWAG